MPDRRRLVGRLEQALQGSVVDLVGAKAAHVAAGGDDRVQHVALFGGKRPTIEIARAFMCTGRIADERNRALVARHVAPSTFAAGWSST